ncbi:MAG TPA: hypothetical protein VMQ76_12695 [Terracidiphilus sp.]|nr:hypothetical protein [Terracidiphilus sp.]
MPEAKEIEPTIKAARLAMAGALDNPRHERFCQLAAGGMSASDSYRLSYCYGQNWRTDNADVLGPRLMGEVGIRDRIGQLRARAGASTVLTLAEAQADLSAAWRTPVGDIDENHPLAQEVEYKADGSKRVKAVPKLGALELLADLAGWRGTGGQTPHIRLRVIASAGAAGTAAELEVD